MKIVIVDSNRFGKLTIERLREFERSLGTTLPRAYRKHLLKHNGGQVDGASRLGLLQNAFGVHDGPRWAQFLDRTNMYGGLIPPRLLPIADDPGGNMFCISLSGSDRGVVYFWDHERGSSEDENLTQLAPNFRMFTRGLAIQVPIARKRLAVVRKFAETIGVNAPVYAGRTLLDLTMERGSLKLVKMLVGMGATMRPDLLVDAVRNVASNTARFLIGRGAEVNCSVTDTGFTPLMMAASRDAAQLVDLLLAHGADPTSKNVWGKSAFDLAHSLEVKQLLQPR